MELVRYIINGVQLVVEPLANYAVNVSKRSIFRESWNMPGFEPLSVIGTGAKIETSNWEKIHASVESFVPDILETEQR